ncbi:L,D-transpeptidase family protein [Sphingomonas canadensis]|uniref:L,D-transpeptidase family protein n=1 Tax=Sphingomonas canadensis TaxID=1219257 RepID=A0ABW3HAR6_9SPHN|nr:L,D-transpeptidase family protein [Sphingomonas canadensis]
MRAVRLVIALLLCCWTAPVLAQGYATSSERLALRPGEFVWFGADSLTPASAGLVGEVTVVVSIPAQLAYVYRGDVLIGVSTVSTGKPGKDTPTGDFTILQKKPFHRSNLYSNAPMPWMQRLTWDGIALHAGRLPGYPASHGCIRLPAEFAKQLFQLTRMGGGVSVVDWPIDDPIQRRTAPPTLYADPSQFASEQYNVVTSAGGSVAPPPALVPVSGDGSQPAATSSWVTGPAKEVAAKDSPAAR